MVKINFPFLLFRMELIENPYVACIVFLLDSGYLECRVKENN